MKRHLITVGGGLLGIFLTIVLLESGQSVIQARQSATSPDFTLETPDMGDVPDLGGTDLGSPDLDADAGDMPVGADETVPADPTNNGLEGKNRVRDIAPDQFGLPQEVTTLPLERIEPRVPLSEPVARPQAIPTVLRHPVALSAGLIRFGDRLLQLDGLAPQKPDRICGEADRAWPCGVVARTAFRNFLRARALICPVPKNGWTGTLTASCTINAVDPAGWLAENGWAEASAGSPLADKVEAARTSRLGFFGDDPRDRTVTPIPFDDGPLDETTEPNAAGPVGEGL